MLIGPLRDWISTRTAVDCPRQKRRQAELHAEGRGYQQNRGGARDTGGGQFPARAQPDTSIVADSSCRSRSLCVHRNTT